MRIAISTDGDYVSAHFGRCPAFTIVDLDQGKITNREIVDNPGHQPGFIPQFLHQKGVSCIICGGMGRRATDFFSQYGIQTIIGVTGTIDDVVERLIQGKLEGGPSLCKPGAGKGYGVEKSSCDHEGEDTHEH
jgi:predicted Fe-Mo cluster-binding NifX family protein